MTSRLNVRTGIILVVVLIIVGLGLAYALQIQRGVAGVAVIGSVQTVDQTIILFDGHPPSTADLNVLDMGTGDLDAFGFFLNPARVPFQAANGGAVPFQLRMEAADVAITRNGATVTSGDGILSLLMGPPGEELLPLRPTPL